jgi:uncharacterized membrane protein
MRAPLRVLGYAVLAACPVATHTLLAMGYPAQVAASIYALQVIVLGAVLTARATYIYKWWLLGAGAAAFLAVAWFAGRYSFFAAAGIPYAAAYVTLLAIFGASLLPGREPVITAISRRIHGGVMRPDVAAYTRGVTVAWCCFFAGQLIVSLALFLFASEVAWSFYVNVLDLPLIAAMFGTEYLYRLTHVKNWPHSTVAQVIGAFSRRNADPAKHPKPAGLAP